MGVLGGHCTRAGNGGGLGADLEREVKGLVQGGDRGGEAEC